MDWYYTYDSRYVFDPDRAMLLELFQAKDDKSAIKHLKKHHGNMSSILVNYEDEIVFVDGCTEPAK